MGAWDMLSDDDPRALGHKCSCSGSLANYSISELRGEIHRQLKEKKAEKVALARKKREIQLEEERQREVRRQTYLKLKKEFE